MSENGGEMKDIIIIRKCNLRELCYHCKRPDFDNPIFLTFEFCFTLYAIQNKPNKIMSLRKELYEPLNKMFTTKMHADVKIIVNKEFLSHKAVLAAKSSVFDNIFKIRGKRRIPIRIDNYDPDTFNIFLRYFYLSEVDIITKENIFIIIQLLKLAVNYKVEDLKSDVSKLAIYTFFPTNVDMWINLSQQYDLPYIKKMAETYTRHCEDAQLPNFFGS